MATFPSSKAGARALSSANWAEVPCGKSLASMGSQHLRLLYTQLFFLHSWQSCFHQCTRLPQDWSEDLFTIPLGVLSSSPKFLGKSEGGQLGKNLTRGYKPGFSISTTWYLRILWSDIHKWPLPFRGCFTWWLVKIVCPQERVLKHLLSGLQ